MSMVTSAGMQYDANTQTERVPLRCPVTGRLMTRVSRSGDWPVDLCMWIWCRGCHAEHEVTREHIEKARTQGERHTHTA